MLFANEADIIPLVRTHREATESAGFVTYRSTLPAVHQSFGFAYFRDQSFCSYNGSSYSPFSSAASAFPPQGLTHACGPRDSVTQ